VSPSAHQVRRATVEDLPALWQLWGAAGLPAKELEKRFTEFQVAANASGQVVAALGLQIAGQHGKLHGEVISAADQADELRALLWNRVLMVAKNHGLARLWTQESAPYWHQNGFVAAGPDALAKLPPALGAPGGAWLSLQLKEESVTQAPSLESEFALFQEASKQETQRMLQQAKTLKLVAAVVAIFVLLLILFAGYLFFRAKGGGLPK
jgi:N-acetylglutamate synthase-like GNAT family acetyltransferase